MKTINSILLFSAMLLMAACGENQNETAQQETAVAETETYQDPNQAMDEWEQAWNNNDSQKLLSQTADDAVLVLNGTEVSQDSISAFLQENGAVMRDLETNSLVTNSAERIAYDTGTFRHSSNADTTANYQGSYTFIWERQENDSIWKIRVINISAEHPAMVENQQ